MGLGKQSSNDQQKLVPFEGTLDRSSSRELPQPKVATSLSLCGGSRATPTKDSDLFFPSESFEQPGETKETGTLRLDEFSLDLVETKKAVFLASVQPCQHS